MSIVSILRRAYQSPRLQHGIQCNLLNREYHRPHDVAEKSQKDKNADLAGFVGKHFTYTYANGWKYEWYCRNAESCDYRIHQGLVGGRWVRKQKIYATKFAENIYRVDWHEPTGTCVSLLFNLLDVKKIIIHGTIFFPQWIAGEGQHPEKTILYQNEFIEDMQRFRDKGPIYPYVIIPEFTTSVVMDDQGVDNDNVIDKAPGQLG